MNAQHDQRLVVEMLGARLKVADCIHHQVGQLIRAERRIPLDQLAELLGVGSEAE